MRFREIKKRFFGLGGNQNKRPSNEDEKKSRGRIWLEEHIAQSELKLRPEFLERGKVELSLDVDPNSFFKRSHLSLVMPLEWIFPDPESVPKDPRGPTFILDRVEAVRLKINHIFRISSEEEVLGIIGKEKEKVKLRGIRFKEKLILEEITPGIEKIVKEIIEKEKE